MQPEKNLPALPDPQCKTWRHIKTGGVYQLVCYAYREIDLVVCAVYRSQHGLLWIRPHQEFLEKFQPIEN